MGVRGSGMLEPGGHFRPVNVAESRGLQVLRSMRENLLYEVFVSDSPQLTQTLVDLGHVACITIFHRDGTTLAVRALRDLVSQAF